MSKVWSEAEKNFLRENAGILKDREIAEMLTVLCKRRITRKAVCRRRQEMGIKKHSGPGRCELVNEPKIDKGPTGPQMEK